LEPPEVAHVGSLFLYRYIFLIFAAARTPSHRRLGMAPLDRDLSILIPSHAVSIDCIWRCKGGAQRRRLGLGLGGMHSASSAMSEKRKPVGGGG
jgi:hypothetical protein